VRGVTRWHGEDQLTPGPSIHKHEEEPKMQVSQNFENWDNFVNKCSVWLHGVDGEGKILWANDTELKAMGYEPDEYIGRFIGDFHVDQDVIQDILARLIKDETLNAYPARLRAKDGSTKYVMINSNVYHEKGGEFGHTRALPRTLARQRGRL
jgi:PAS domain S-box-containing protein